LSFSNSFLDIDFFKKEYQSFNIFYDSVINKIKKFEAIRKLYNKKVQYIKSQLKCKNCDFDSGSACSICKEKKNCANIDNANFCQECLAEYCLNTLKLPV
jgi:hypothetical protein